jgi:hypothetical protein
LLTLQDEQQAAHGQQAAPNSVLCEFCSIIRAALSVSSNSMSWYSYMNASTIIFVDMCAAPPDSVTLRLVPRRKKKVRTVRLVCVPHHVLFGSGSTGCAACNVAAANHVFFTHTSVPAGRCALACTVWRVVADFLTAAVAAAAAAALFEQQSVKWAEDVEDYDENAGKRKSKSGWRAQHVRPRSSSVHCPCQSPTVVMRTNMAACRNLFGGHLSQVSGICMVTVALSSGLVGGSLLTRMCSTSAACICAECCIFHRRRQFGDWSDDDDSDADCDCGDGQQPDKQQQQPPEQQPQQLQQSGRWRYEEAHDVW